MVSTYVPKLPAITLAFATGACGSENWGGVQVRLRSENVPQLQSGRPEIRGLDRRRSRHLHLRLRSGHGIVHRPLRQPGLVGIDFDIEGGQSPIGHPEPGRRRGGSAGAVPEHPVTFTLATLAASDGSFGGVNSLGNEVVQAVLGSSLKNYVINLMTMDFGSASSSVCVVVSGSCEMAQSAIQAVKNLEHTYGIPASKIAVTPMIGLNDNTSETFTAGDVNTLTSYVKSKGLAGLHFWSLDRDTPCSDTFRVPRPATPFPSTTPLEYTKDFLSDLGD